MSHKVSTTIVLGEENLTRILRKHFKQPEATVSIECRSGVRHEVLVFYSGPAGMVGPLNWPKWIYTRLRGRLAVAAMTLHIWGPWAAVKMFFLGFKR